MMPKVAVDAAVVGGSSGAIAALVELLPSLSPATSFPVIVVVHIPAQRPSLLVKIFGPRCAVPVREPLDKEPLAPGVWFAPPDYHLLVSDRQSFALSDDEQVNFSRPSIDVLFESAADVFGGNVVAVILTGANEDGARGAAAVRDAGGFVAVQDPATAEVPIMPAAAILRARPQLVAPLPVIAELFSNLSRASTP
ncbi:MAG TPA: chemotaxis protein CheB [Polyangiaceae bacterium]|jgi:two-component system chemotaxis response regulator CheB